MMLALTHPVWSAQVTDRGVDCAIANAWLCGYMEHEEASKGPMNERLEADWAATEAVRKSMHGL